MRAHLYRLAAHLMCAALLAGVLLGAAAVCEGLCRIAGCG